MMPLPTATTSLPRRALVTGASTGLGAAFATALAQRHYDLVIVARRRDRLEALAHQLRQRYGVAVDVLVADLTRDEALRTVEEAVVTDAGLTLVVNNAGFGTTGRFITLDPEQEEAEIRLNVMALVRLTRAALPGMVARRHGSIINMSSLAAFLPGPYDATYGATKAFVNSFTEALSEELRGTGVSVQALCPGFTHTEFQQRAGVDVTHVPAWVWMSAEAVVEASLAALERRVVVCIPGWYNRLLALGVRLTPRCLVRRMAAMLAQRVVAP